MSLPILNTAKYDLTLPISKKKVTFRPFLMKEQKILMMASESKDSKQVSNVIKRLLTSCCENLPSSVEEMSVFDVETLFLHLRAKSVGETVDLRFKCECGGTITQKINLLEIPITNRNFLEDSKGLIALTPEIGIKIKPIKFGMVQSILDTASISESTDKTGFAAWLSVIETAIESVYDKTQVYPFHESTKEERDRFIDSLSVDQLFKIVTFFNNSPKYQLDISIPCPKCTKEFKQTVESIYDFFT